MTVVSHILDHNWLCARCGADMTGLQIPTVDYHKVKRGDRIGVISGLKFAPDSAYLIAQTEFDSNQFCIPRRDSIP